MVRNEVSPEGRQRLNKCSLKDVYFKLKTSFEYARPQLLTDVSLS
jgi:hypothetical protein